MSVRPPRSSSLCSSKPRRLPRGRVSSRAEPTTAVTATSFPLSPINAGAYHTCGVAPTMGVLLGV